MDTETINKFLSSICETAKYYKGCFPADVIPYPKIFPASMVVNLDDKHEPGSHWTAVWCRSPSEVWFFDSYGQKPEGELKKYLQRFGKLVVNTCVIQSIISNVCAYYAMYFVYSVSIGQDFEQVLTNLAIVNNPDLYVSKFMKNIVAT